MNRVVTGVAKVGVFVCIVVIGVIVLRGTSLSTRLSEAWAMHGCVDAVRADLQTLLAEKKPKVVSCVGPAVRAVCQVETTENGEGGASAVKTAPLSGWDCTRRHVPDGQGGMLMKMMIASRVNGASVNRRLLQIAAGVSTADMRLFDEMDAVARLLDTRQAIIDGR